ncbi:MAG: MBOAT family protein [Oscillospiraceae bacterium]|jgi:alginate O-acetyltransferase complex protein AlgI|nr:MBOAT family protein [Oscillospiraceae bacterium]
MLFSSVTFLYWFLPVVLVVYFLIPDGRGQKQMPRNMWLLLSSLVFYAWGEPEYAILMVLQILSGWFFGLLIERFRGGIGAKLALIAALAVGLGGLAFFKYADFFLANLNRLPGVDIPLLKIALPIGISFYTFQALSYDIDLYRNEAAVQKNPLLLATYVVLFPQLIAGPIVRYVDVARELKSRKTTLEDFGVGARRFVAGLAKKVLIANTLAEVVGIFAAENNALAAWLYLITYGLQIYFDFSGYSDMAIGLGKILGFKFLENFDYPYISRSITEFWRRWHISLSSWFRDYVYITLGGNRRGAARQVLNILVVWLLTGFWHGAGWNFILWGLYFGLLLLIEKFLLEKPLKKLPSALSHVYVIALVLISWVFFNSFSAGEIAHRLGLLVGAGTGGAYTAKTLYYLRSYFVPILIAIIGATPLPKNLLTIAENSRSLKTALAAAEPIAVAVLLIAVSAYLADGSFNPFIYFRF